jgi:small conductance mechanosensitive channel
MDISSIETFLRTTVAALAVKVLAAIAFWFVGRWLIGRVIGLVQAAMHRNDIDATLTRYLGSIVSVALNIALVLGILGYFGIQTTSIAAMATSRPERSCWCCARSRSATSSASAG